MLTFIALFTFLYLVDGDADRYGIKIAANNHLLASLTIGSSYSSNLVRYKCTNDINEFRYTPLNFSHSSSISMGKLQNESQLYFVVAGMVDHKPYMSKISVKCDNSSIEIKKVSYEELIYSSRNDYFVVTVDPHGRFAIGCTSFAILFYDLVSLKYWSTNITWSESAIFFPTAIDISTLYLYIVGYSPDADNVSEYFKANLYVISINFINSKYDIELYCTWKSNSLLTFTPHKDFISVSVIYDTDTTKILIGIPPANTVHLLSFKYTARICLQHISSKIRSDDNSRRGYGAGVAWLNQGQTVVVLDANIRKNGIEPNSILYYYDMLENGQITNETAELSIFPSNGQYYPYRFKGNLIFIVASFSLSSTLYGYDGDGEVLVILPSLPGYYSVHYESLPDMRNEERLFFLIPNSAQCWSGTYKNDIGVWPCGNCKAAVTTSSVLQYQSNSSVSLTCPQCINKTACPLETVTAPYLPDIEQSYVYPESSESDTFDSILMDNMFRTVWNLKSPFFISMILLLLVLFTGLIINLMKISKRFASKQQSLIKLFRHLDLIGQGQLWFGGLISLVLLFLAIFAAIFSHSYNYRYPIEKQTCTDTDYYDFNKDCNAKFDTSLQLLSSSTKQYEQIFSLLNSQQFTLHIELINTRIHCGRLRVLHVESNGTLPFLCYSSDHILYSSIKLAVHNLNLLLTMSSNETIDAIGIGITGPNAHLTVNYVQTLNFSKTFNQTDRYLSQIPHINLQLTKTINITEGLKDSDETTYTGIWLPTYTYDIDQLFNNRNLSKRNKNTILSLQISETVFFVKNKQKPIARSAEIIFHTVLFVGICIDLTCMILLLLKMWFVPIIIFFIRKMFRPNSLVVRLVNTKENSSETLTLAEKLNALEIEIKQIQQQYGPMSNRV